MLIWDCPQGVEPHCVVRGLYGAQSGTFLHHEAEQTRENGGHGPGGVPRVRVEVCDGET